MDNNRTFFNNEGTNILIVLNVVYNFIVVLNNEKTNSYFAF